MVNDRRKRSLFNGLVADITKDFVASDKTHISIGNDLTDIPSTSSFSVEPSTVTLSNGVNMPLLGLGTTHSGGYYHDAVLHALRHSGYRMIDTARRYGVEAELGIAIRDCGVSREELFVSTKLWPTDYGVGVETAFSKQCAKLKVDYLDLLMLHFPDTPQWLGNPRDVREETWRRMELLYDQGKCRSIGVSNFDVADLEELEDFASILPHVNQCEYHPLYDPIELREYCTELGVLFTGYCPLAKGRALKNETIQQIARKHGRTPAQICLRWSVENGIPVIPKSKDISRIEENSQIFDFSLSPEDHELIASLNSPSNKVLKHEDLTDKWNLPDGYKLAGRVYGVPSETPIDTNKPETKYRIVKLQSITNSPSMTHKGF